MTTELAEIGLTGDRLTPVELSAKLEIFMKQEVFGI